MSASILSIRGLTKRFGAHVVSDNIDFDLLPGEVHAVIGPNGAGKTTLINQLIGELTPDAGTVHFDGHDITAMPIYQRSLLGLSRSYQITSVFPDFTALENVAIAAQAHDGLSFGIWHPASQEARLNEPSLAALDKVGLKAKAHRLASELAHGERRQLEIAMALVSKSKVLLLDEPMAGMGQEDVGRIADLIRDVARSRAVLMVEHNLSVVADICHHVTVLQRGEILAEGDYESVSRDPRVREAYMGSEEA